MPSLFKIKENKTIKINKDFSGKFPLNPFIKAGI